MFETARLVEILVGFLSGCFLFCTLTSELRIVSGDIRYSLQEWKKYDNDCTYMYGYGPEMFEGQYLGCFLYRGSFLDFSHGKRIEFWNH